MNATGGGLGDEQDADQDAAAMVSSNLYVPPEGPDHDTTADAKNLWGKPYLSLPSYRTDEALGTEDMQSAFLYFLLTP